METARFLDRLTSEADAVRRARLSWNVAEDGPQDVPDLTGGVWPADCGARWKLLARVGRSLNWRGYVCTRAAGHTGRHAAGYAGRVVAVWAGDRP